jgi:Collagen triple helix repeat (20 copies)
MKRYRWIVAVAIVVILSSALPAVGAPSPVRIAKKALKTAKQANKRSRQAMKRAGKRGLRGETGPAGPQGNGGPQGNNGVNGTNGSDGAPGVTGATGPVGPSTVLEAVNSNQVTIVGSDVSTATSIATLANLPAGDYLVVARIQLNANSGSPTLNAKVACRALLGAKSSLAIVDIGSNANSVAHAPATIAFNATIGLPSDASVQCWNESLTGGAPNASDSYVEALKVGAASSQSVSG